MTRHIPVRLTLAATVLLLFLFTVLAHQNDAQASPPGPETAQMASFDITEPPEAFEIVTLVLDFPPGSVVPLHTHPGRGSNILLSGELVEVDENGNETTLSAGEGWIEEQGRRHIVRNTSSEPARLLFTVLVPEGEELVTFHE